MAKTDSFANRLKHLLEIRHITQAELSRKTGISTSSISHYIKGDWEGKQNAVYAIAKATNVNEAWLMGLDVAMDRVESPSLPSNIIPMPRMRKIPLLGTIACGEPILAVENLDGEVDIPEDIKADFALRCKGDSMVGADIQDGDVVYIKQQEAVQDGQIAAVLIDDEATLKRFYYDERTNIVTLMAENPAIAPLVYQGETLDHIRILGRAVGLTRSFI